MEKSLSQTWDLDVFFPGGSRSPEFARFLEQLEADVGSFAERLGAAGQAEVGVPLLTDLVGTLQDLQQRMSEAGAFVSCLTAQDVKDEQAKLLEGRVRQLSSRLQAILTRFEALLRQVPDDTWRQVVADPALAPVAFALNEIRERAAEKLPPEQEALATALAVDGYHAWSQLYHTVVGRITIPFEADGQTVQLSVGQAFNRMMEDPDRSVRQTLFARWEEAWAREAELCAAALNHLAGFRLALYRSRGWDSVLKEPLDRNRMSQATLEAMWDVVNRNKDHLVAYLQRKARILGVDRLAWYDLSAPIGKLTRRIPYDEAAEFIVENFRRFSPAMADFAARAFRERWIEAEDRPGKRPGGFCTSFRLSRQSRIFLTYSGTPGGVSTLAHELGHAYHQHVMNDLPPLVQNYAMNVAETASTFAEMVVVDAAIQAAASPEERLALLEDKIQRSVAFFMDIHARFLFETRFYEARKKGLLTVADLNGLMLEAQKEAFRDALGEYHPHFWASKLHFYITYWPFYNFPYTFGYLFSYGVYARARAEGPSFADRYVALLRDTGRMTVEDLARKHLGVDLTQPDFWQSAADLVVEDIREFLRLTE
ncbi:MAG: M3 family oligoendopeptidase [Bacillota bacterium]